MLMRLAVWRTDPQGKFSFLRTLVRNDTTAQTLLLVIYVINAYVKLWNTWLYRSTTVDVWHLFQSLPSLSVHSRYLSTDTQKVVGGVLVGTGLWVTIIMIMRNVLKSLLSWHGWMYERHGSISWTSRAWMVRWHVSIWTILNKFEGHWGEIFLCTVTV